jgi:ubiquinone/menaquinone biosynthesis C-methylase UbiE
LNYSLQGLCLLEFSSQVTAAGIGLEILYFAQEGHKVSEKILAYYEDYTLRAGEDNRATSSRSASIEFHYTKKILGEFINKDNKVLEVGCGTGYYGMFFADKCKEYIGIDLFPHHIEIFQRKIQEHGINNLSCCVGDATNLEGMDDSSFDIVLCLGPMYHLPQDMREIVFAECNRVCKSGGIIVFAFINKIGTYFAACLHDDLRNNYPNQNANDKVLKEGVNDVDNPFFFTTPEEMVSAASRHGLSKVRTAGLDFFGLTAIADKMDDEKFGFYLGLLDEATSHESCAGMSEHALLICKKIPNL